MAQNHLSLIPFSEADAWPIGINGYTREQMWDAVLRMNERSTSLTSDLQRAQYTGFRVAQDLGLGYALGEQPQPSPFLVLPEQNTGRIVEAQA